jgi:putative nucleotidyltransferase with HDIG domain
MKSTKLLSFFGFLDIPNELIFTPSIIEGIVSSPNLLDDKEIHATIILFDKLKNIDYQTALHSVEVAYISLWIARKFLPKYLWLEVFLGGLLHDIGKLSFNSRLFGGARDLTHDEIVLIKQHTVVGVEKIKDLIDSKIVTEMVLYHHESNDGTGYPFGFLGNELSMYAKIARVSDVLSALTLSRNYRDIVRIPISDAISIMKKQSQYFDPVLLHEIDQVITREILLV